MIKRISRDFNIFAKKNKMLCFSFYHKLDLQTVTNNESKDILFLMPRLKTKTRGEHLASWFRRVNFSYCHLLSHSHEEGASWEIYGPEVNVSKSVTRMTKRGVFMRTDYIGRECPYVLSTSRYCSGWATGYKIGRQRLFWLCSTF